MEHHLISQSLKCTTSWDITCDQCWGAEARNYTFLEGAGAVKKYIEPVQLNLFRGSRSQSYSRKKTPKNGSQEPGQGVGPF